MESKDKSYQEIIKSNFFDLKKKRKKTNFVILENEEQIKELQAHLDKANKEVTEMKQVGIFYFVFLEIYSC